MGVHFYFWFGYYPSTGVDLWLLSLWEAILVISLVCEAKIIIFVRRAIIPSTRAPSSRLGTRDV
jgi:hypothetical protein